MISALSILSGASLTAGARWQRLGPDGAGLAGPTAIDPLQPSVVYVSGGAGVYKSVDGGDTWQPASDGLSGGVPSALVIDPQTPSTLYALTQDGVFKSTDGGFGWFSANCGLPASGARDLDIDPFDPSVLYAPAAGEGMFKSADGGLSWSPSNTGLEGMDVRLVAVARSSPTVVYAGAFGGGVFRSTDGGMTWQPVNTGLPDLRVTLLEVSPGNEQVVLASTLGDSGTLLRSTNGGGSWQPSSSGLRGGRPFVVAFDPGNADVVYAGQVLDGVFKSTNGGAGWTEANNGIPLGQGLGIGGLAVDPSDSSRVFASTLDGGPGVFRSPDAAASWAPAGVGLDLHRVLDVVVDPVDSRTLYAVTDDRNALYKSTDAGATWQRMAEGFRDQLGLFDNLGLSLAIDPGNRQVLYLGSNGDGLFRTANGGALWERVVSPVFQDRFVSAVRVDPTNSSVLYAATSDGGVVRSSNSGASWSNTGNQITAVVSDIEVDPGEAPRVYALTSEVEGVFRTTNSGNSWSRIAVGLAGAQPADLQIDSSDPSTLYLATRLNGVFKSVDRGDSWSAVNQGLGDLRTQAVAVAEGVVYAGTRRGVYRSRDGGQTWSLAAPGLLNRFIVSLTADPDDPETVYVGTDSNGVYRRVRQPAYLYAAGRVDDRPQFDGLAFSNFSLETASLGLRQVASRVAAAAEADGATPAGASGELQLSPGEQVARTRAQIFPGSGDGSAWVEQVSDVTELASFFQFGSSDLTQLDGGVAAEQTLTEFLFTRVFEGPGAFRGETATTRLSIFNPNPTAVTVQLGYFPLLPGPPGPPARQVSREIPPESFLEGSFSQLFQTDSSGGYVRGTVTAGDGVVAFALIQLPDRQTILGLNAARLDRPGRSYSAQLASQDGIFTNVNLINASHSERRVTLRAVDESGDPIGDAVNQILDAGEQLSMDAGALFGPAATSPAQAADFVGSLIVEADGEGVAGDVIFGDPGDFRFAAALPLQSEPFTEAVFSQVANVTGFFTGLALFYPGSPFEADCSTGAEVEIEVIHADGMVAGSAVRELQRGQRLSELLPQLVPASAGQAGGYIRIRSNRPLIAQMLFGALDGQGIRLFSAVPPKVVR